MATHGMRMAKASKRDIKALHDYLLKAEQRNAKGFPIGWRRVVWGCDMLIDHCCDPNLDYLALKPELANKEQKVQVSDTTESASSNSVD
jgi:hypothetical protein